MENLPKDLSQRIAEAARLAVQLHLQELIGETGEASGAEFDLDRAVSARSTGNQIQRVESEAA